MSRTLALDLGSVRIGVALSSPFGNFAQPLVVLDRRKGGAMEKILTLLDEHEISTIVLGRPTTLAGEAGPAVIATEKFAHALRARTQIPVVFWDERLTTREAERSLISAGVRRDARKQRIDKVAAALILQGYLDACEARSFNDT